MNLNNQLIEASKNGNLEEAMSLLDRGADIHAENDRVLRSASSNGHTEIVKLLLENGANIHAWNDPPPPPPLGLRKRTYRDS